MVMDGDVPVVESGGAKDFYYTKDLYPAVTVDRVLHDGDEVRLGGVVLVAHKTAGHTRGCTTWTMRAPMGGQLRDVVIVGSWNVNPGFRLVTGRGGPLLIRDCCGLSANLCHVEGLAVRCIPRRTRRLFRHAGEAGESESWSRREGLDRSAGLSRSSGRSATGI